MCVEQMKHTKTNEKGKTEMQWDHSISFFTEHPFPEYCLWKNCSSTANFKYNLCLAPDFDMELPACRCLGRESVVKIESKHIKSRLVRD